MKEPEIVVRRPTGPVVALETAFLTCGLPSPVRLQTVETLEAAVRSRGAAPSFVGVVGGQAFVGLERAELEVLAAQTRKLSTRDLAMARLRGQHGGTTVAATLFLAHRSGLTVVATGGIGGVHPRDGAPDVSADLRELARTPVIVVCSGPKAITDLPATLEHLETLGVGVLGYRTEELPAFWSAQSGLALNARADSPQEIAELWRTARSLEVPGSLVVCAPPPPEAALPAQEGEWAVRQALDEQRRQRVTGPEVTPFLLDRVAEITEGRSLRANLALLENNAALAAAIATCLED